MPLHPRGEAEQSPHVPVLSPEMRPAMVPGVLQAPQQQEPEPRIQDARRGHQTGRPRLDAQEDFVGGFCQLLPRLNDGSMSKAEAARRLGVSVRSVGRYLEMDPSRHGWTC